MKFCIALISVSILGLAACKNKNDLREASNKAEKPAAQANFTSDPTRAVNVDSPSNVYPELPVEASNLDMNPVVSGPLLMICDVEEYLSSGDSDSPEPKPANLSAKIFFYEQDHLFRLVNGFDHEGKFFEKRPACSWGYGTFSNPSILVDKNGDITMTLNGETRDEGDFPYKVEMTAKYLKSTNAGIFSCKSSNGRNNGWIRSKIRNCKAGGKNFDWTIVSSPPIGSLDPAVRIGFYGLTREKQLKVRLKDGLLTGLGYGTIICRAGGGQRDLDFPSGMVEYLIQGHITSVCDVKEMEFIYTMTREEFDRYVQEGRRDPTDKVEVDSSGMFKLIKADKSATFYLRMRPLDSTSFVLKAEVVAVKEH